MTHYNSLLYYSLEKYLMTFIVPISSYIVCDNKYIFRDINIGWPRRVHDARVFVNSEIFHKGETSTLLPKSSLIIRPCSTPFLTSFPL